MRIKKFNVGLLDFNQLSKQDESPEGASPVPTHVGDPGAPTSVGNVTDLFLGLAWQVTALRTDLAPVNRLLEPYGLRLTTIEVPASGDETEEPGEGVTKPSRKRVFEPDSDEELQCTGSLLGSPAGDGQGTGLEGLRCETSSVTLLRFGAVPEQLSSG